MSNRERKERENPITEAIEILSDYIGDIEGFIFDVSKMKPKTDREREIVKRAIKLKDYGEKKTAGILSK